MGTQGTEPSVQLIPLEPLMRLMRKFGVNGLIARYFESAPGGHGIQMLAQAHQAVGGFFDVFMNLLGV